MENEKLDNASKYEWQNVYAGAGHLRQHKASVMDGCHRNRSLPVIRLMHRTVGEVRRKAGYEIMRPRSSCGRFVCVNEERTAWLICKGVC